MAALTFGSTTGLLTTIYSSLFTGWRNCDNGNQSYSKKQVHYEELKQYYPDLIICTHRLMFHTYFTCIT